MFASLIGVDDHHDSYNQSDGLITAYSQNDYSSSMLNDQGTRPAELDKQVYAKKNASNVDFEEAAYVTRLEGQREELRHELQSYISSKMVSRSSQSRFSKPAVPAI